MTVGSSVHLFTFIYIYIYKTLNTLPDKYFGGNMQTYASGANFVSTWHSSAWAPSEVCRSWLAQSTCIRCFEIQEIGYIS